MTTTAGTRRAVVVGVDGSLSGEAALDWAVDEAARRHLPLHLVHAFAFEYPVIGVGGMPESEVMLVAATGLVESAAARATAAAPGLTVTTATPQDYAPHALVSASEHADTVVVGARGLGGVRGLLVGSVSLQVATHAHCPVVVVPEAARALAGLGGPEEEEGIPSDEDRMIEPPEGAAPLERGRVVVGVDGSELSSAALGYAFMEASERGCGLTAVNAWLLNAPSISLAESGITFDPELLEGQQKILLAESLAGWSEKYPDVEVQRRTVHADPTEALVIESVGAELLVVGSRGRGGFSGLLLGSVSQGVLHRAHCPVAIVRNRPTEAS